MNLFLLSSTVCVRGNSIWSTSSKQFGCKNLSAQNFSLQLHIFRTQKEVNATFLGKASDYRLSQLNGHFRIKRAEAEAEDTCHVEFTSPQLSGKFFPRCLGFADGKQIPSSHDWQMVTTVTSPHSSLGRSMTSVKKETFMSRTLSCQSASLNKRDPSWHALTASHVQDGERRRRVGKEEELAENKESEQ